MSFVKADRLQRTDSIRPHCPSNNPLATKIPKTIKPSGHEACVLIQRHISGGINHKGPRPRDRKRSNTICKATRQAYPNRIVRGPNETTARKEHNPQATTEAFKFPLERQHRYNSPPKISSATLIQSMSIPSKRPVRHAR